MINCKVTQTRLVFYVEFEALFALEINPEKDFIPKIGDIYWHDGLPWFIKKRHFNYDYIKDKPGELYQKIALELLNLDIENYAELSSRMDTNLTKDIIKKGG